MRSIIEMIPFSRDDWRYCPNPIRYRRPVVCMGTTRDASGDPGICQFVARSRRQARALARQFCREVNA